MKRAVRKKARQRECQILEERIKKIEKKREKDWGRRRIERKYSEIKIDGERE
jgi:hypothetical protein